MVWYRVIIVSALSQRKRVKRERELDNTKCQPTNHWYYVFYLKRSHKAFFPFFAQSIYRSTFLFRNILHIPTGFDTSDILNLFFTFQKNSLYSNKIALGVVLTYLNLSQIFKLKLGSWISFEVLTRKFKATFYSFKRNKK